MSLSDILKFTFIEASQAQKHITVNDNLAMADALIQIAVKDMFVNTPPGSPAGGDRYVVGGSPTGAWVGKSYKIAHSLNGTWRFYDPKPGMQAYSYAQNAVYTVDLNFAWVPEFACGGLNSVTFSAFTKTSDVTLANITNLTATLGVGTYAFSGYLPCTSGAAGGVKLALGGTCVLSKVTATGQVRNAGAVVQGQQHIATSGSPSGTVAAYTGVATEMYVEGTITVATAGTLTLRFAQNVSNATPSSVLTDARMMIQRIL